MSNCTKLFLDFNKEITPTSSQLETMRKSRIALEEKITAKFLDKGLNSPSYYTQGSSARGINTIIIKVDGSFDADRGVYLPDKPEVSAETVQRYVYEAVKDHTEDGAEHKQKCIRVFYKCEYDIDFTVYYEVSQESYSYLAIKDDGWVKDDPSKMSAWFQEKKDSEGQLVRLVKYLKAWASKKNSDFKMPSGIAFTVWAANNFQASKNRDDVALLNTLKAIHLSVSSRVYCTCPVVPYDDLVAKRNDDQKKKFLNALELFCNDAQNAVDATNQLEASKLWRKHLGDRFDLGVDEDVDRKEKALMESASAALSNNPKLDFNGKINQNNGVPSLNHRNYGA